MGLYCVFMLVMRLYCVFVLIMQPLNVIGNFFDVWYIYICELYPYIMLNLYICNLRCALCSADWLLCCIFFFCLWRTFADGYAVDRSLRRRIIRRPKTKTTESSSSFLPKNTKPV